MAMEKRGVVDAENEQPPATKEAAQKTCTPGCCKQACGTDPLSKIAEAAKEAAVKDK